MLSWLKRPHELAVEFCDCCAKVCDASCRRTAIKEQAQLRAIRFGLRF
jgi:hypothetical protein